MEKNQYELCIEVLKRLEKAGILNDIILIGSWCIPFYKDYFGGVKYPAAITTRDIDFLIPTPAKITTKADIPELLKDLGFIVGFKGPEGYIQLEHSDLIIEFLVPEKGRGLDKPYKLPQFGLNAQALRFLDLLIEETIKVNVEDIEFSLPHPVNFAFHKLIISRRRLKEEKALKDVNTGAEILSALIAKNDLGKIRNVFDSLLPKWQKKIIERLDKIKDKEILKLLEKRK